MDMALLQTALAAGVQFEARVAVRRALLDSSGATAVAGVVVGQRAVKAGASESAAASAERTIRAKVVIAADGRRSTIAFGLGLARHPRTPRRWAIGAYFENVGGMSAFGEMHIRRGRYIGVAPLPGGITNVCLVKPSQPADKDLKDAAALLRNELTRDPLLADRFADARLVARPVVLGPLAVDAAGGAIQGLLLAGDAAGFVDPMTGDGLRFAVRGGEMAADAAREALEHGWGGVHVRLASAQRREFAAKWRFNRTLRALVASPAAVRIGGGVASAAPAIIRGIVRHAGDCHLARPVLYSADRLPG
jgi:flavin-dependent dehydrogenase